MRDNKGQVQSPSSPGRSRPWDGLSSPIGGGVAGTAAPYFDYSDNPLDSPEASAIEFSSEADTLLSELSLFFRTRRVEVQDAFTDFELPGRFCKRVRRVTRFQFREVLNFICKGLTGLTEEHILLLSDCFDDGTGLIRYRDFIRAVEWQLERPGGAGAIPHAANSNPPKTAILRGSVSPERDRRSGVLK